MNLKEFAEAILILSKYTDKKYAISCSHEIIIVQVSPDDVSDEDIDRLKKMSFYPDRVYDDSDESGYIRGRDDYDSQFGGDCFFYYT
jgi:hypothetical protein